MSEWSKRHDSFEDSRGRSVSPPALAAWVCYSYLPDLWVNTRETWDVVQEGPPDALGFWSVNSIQRKLSTQTYVERTSCLLSADWIIFNYCLCILAERSWARGWPSVTGNIPGCLKAASTCCGKPTARCRQRRAASKKTNISSEIRVFLSRFPISFLVPVT